MAGFRRAQNAGVVTVGAGMLVFLRASPAAACPVALPVTGVGGQAVQAAQAVGGSSSGGLVVPGGLPFTGAPVVPLVVGAVVLILTGCLLRNLGTRRPPLRPARLITGLGFLVALVLGMGSPARASAGHLGTAVECSSTLVPTSGPVELGPHGVRSAIGATGPSGSGGADAPAPVVPESPLPILLPVGALAVAIVVGRGKMRST